jgi:hypothetical protein
VKKFTLTDEAGILVIRRPDRSVLFTLRLFDRTFAEEILFNLNAE